VRVLTRVKYTQSFHYNSPYIKYSIILSHTLARAGWGRELLGEASYVEFAVLLEHGARDEGQSCDVLDRLNSYHVLRESSRKQKASKRCVWRREAEGVSGGKLRQGAARALRNVH